MIIHKQIKVRIKLNLVKTLENVISELKTNQFNKLRSEIEERNIVKTHCEKEIELLKSKIKLKREEIKNSFKNTHNLQTSNKHYEAMENRISHEMTVNVNFNDFKNEISKMKFEYEQKVEENRILRNDILLEEKALKTTKEDIQKTNKLITDTNKERDCIKFNFPQLKRHIALMRQKINDLNNKNKDLLTTVYEMAL